LLVLVSRCVGLGKGSLWPSKKVFAEAISVALVDWLGALGNGGVSISLGLGSAEGTFGTEGLEGGEDAAVASSGSTATGLN
jgi:hypothetical protein